MSLYLLLKDLLFPGELGIRLLIWLGWFSWFLITGPLYDFWASVLLPPTMLLAYLFFLRF